MIKSQLRPNSRFLFYQLKENSIVFNLLNFVDDFITNSSQHYYAHDFCILRYENQYFSVGRDIVGPVIDSKLLKNDLSCIDLKATMSTKVEVDKDILKLPLKNIEKIAVDAMQCEDNIKKPWELWWPQNERNNPFFLF